MTLRDVMLNRLGYPSASVRISVMTYICYEFTFYCQSYGDLKNCWIYHRTSHGIIEKLKTVQCYGRPEDFTDGQKTQKEYWT